MSDTLEEARKMIAAQRTQPGGVDCPCCGQLVKIYKRKLNSSMARALMLIYQYFQRPDAEEWLHVPSLLAENDQNRSDEAKLQHWGLITQMQGKRADGSKRVGYYKMTDHGKQFVLGEVRVPQHALLFNQKFFGFSFETTNIYEALGDKFNYDELMSA
jgi:hypothetical protein